MIQGSQEWFKARCGMITASKMADVMMDNSKVGRNKYKSVLAVERMTGIVNNNDYMSAAMKRGTDLEPEARRLYSIVFDTDVEEVGVIGHPQIANALASPDGLCSGNGSLEIKCPELHTAIEYWVSKKVPRNYLLQIYWQQACAGVEWTDFVSYAPELPGNLKLLRIRVQRDDEQIKVLEKQVEIFDQEVEELVNKLTLLNEEQES